MGMAGSQRCGSVPESRARVPRGVCHHPLQSACVPRGCASISRDCASFPRTVPGPGGGVCWCPRGGASVPRGCASVARKSASFPRAVPGPQQGAGVPGVSCVVVVSPALALGCAAVCRCPRGCARSPGDAGVPRRVLVFQGCVVVTRARTRVPSSVPASPGLCQVLGRAGSGQQGQHGGVPVQWGNRVTIGGPEVLPGGPRCYQGPAAQGTCVCSWEIRVGSVGVWRCIPAALLAFKLRGSGEGHGDTRRAWPRAGG